MVAPAFLLPETTTVLFYLQLYPALPGCEDWKTGPPTKYPQLNKQLQSREVQNSWPVLS